MLDWDFMSNKVEVIRDRDGPSLSYSDDMAQFFFSNSSKGFNKFLQILKTYLPDGYNLCNVTISMEATTHYYVVFTRCFPCIVVVLVLSIVNT